MVLGFIGGALLIYAGVAGIRTWRLLGAGAPGATYWLLAGMGLVYLAFDEMLDVHETLGRNLWQEGVAQPPGFNHLDDFIVLMYALAGVAVSLYYRRELLRHSAVLAPFVMTLGFTAVAIVVDTTAPVDGVAPYFEECAEFAGTLLFAVALRRRYFLARSEVALGRRDRVAGDGYARA